MMDRACEGNDTRQLALDLGFVPVVPPMKSRIEPWEYNREMYKRRNEVERLFRRLKDYRRIFSRFEKLDLMFLGLVSFVPVFDRLRMYQQAPSPNKAGEDFITFSQPRAFPASNREPPQLAAALDVAGRSRPQQHTVKEDGGELIDGLQAVHQFRPKYGPFPPHPEKAGQSFGVLPWGKFSDRYGFFQTIRHTLLPRQQNTLQPFPKLCVQCGELLSEIANQAASLEVELHHAVLCVENKVPQALHR